VFHIVSTAVPAAWSYPLGRMFNDKEELYLIVELPGRWIPPPLKDDHPEIRERCINDSQEYHGTFITTAGCTTPIGDMDMETIAWGVTQQLALP
jgi:hypothetical protein